jgi:hypothetical protein
VLRSAAAFLGGFTKPALEAVAEQPVGPQLDELLDVSLVRRHRHTERFELLELVRAFALEQLQTEGQASQARARYRRYFATYVAPAIVAFDAQPMDREIAASLRADHANLRSALDDAIAASDRESAVALALGLRPLWFAGMLRQECHDRVDEVLATFALPADSELLLLRAGEYLDGMRVGETGWTRRVAARAAELGDTEVVATATCNLFAHALNAQDRDEMRRLRPALLAAITPDASPKTLAVTHVFLAIDAYIDGRWQAASEHALISVHQSEALGFEYMLGNAVGTRLLIDSARDESIAQPVLLEALEIMRRPGAAPLAAFALWLVARYAAGVAPDTAGQWLAHAERIIIAGDLQLWPESDLRDETMTVLGLGDLAPLLPSNPPLDPDTALAAAAAWLADRDPTETADRPQPVRALRGF